MIPAPASFHDATVDWSIVNAATTSHAPIIAFHQLRTSAWYAPEARISAKAPTTSPERMSFHLGSVVG